MGFSVKLAYALPVTLTRGMALHNPLLLRLLSLFALQVIKGSLASAVASFTSLKARNLANFQPICEILVSKIIFKFSGMWLHGPVRLIVTFSYSIKCRTTFLRYSTEKHCNPGSNKGITYDLQSIIESAWSS